MSRNMRWKKEEQIIRVLMIVPTISVISGVMNFAMSYFRKMDKTKIYMDFAYYQDWPNTYENEIRKEKVNIYKLPPVKNIISHVKMCQEIIEKGNYDIIHDNCLINTLPIMLLAKNKGVLVRILHSHSSMLGETKLKSIRNKIFLPLLRWTSTSYVACSERAGKVMFHNNKYIIMPNVISVEKFRFDIELRNKIRKEKNVEGKFVIGTVARVAEPKNPFFAVDVFKALSEVYLDVEYWWIGSGPLDRQVEKYVEKLGLSKKVRLMGSCDNVSDLYQAMDCFLMPSRFEGLLIAGVEAQAMGLPCVLSSEIPKTLEYTDLIEYVSLSEPISKWRDVIYQFGIYKKRKTKREAYNDKLLKSDFADTGCGTKLQKFYYKEILNSKKGNIT